MTVPASLVTWSGTLNCGCIVGQTEGATYAIPCLDHTLKTRCIFCDGAHLVGQGCPKLDDLVDDLVDAAMEADPRILADVQEARRLLNEKPIPARGRKLL